METFIERKYIIEVVCFYQFGTTANCQFSVHWSLNPRGPSLDLILNVHTRGLSRAPSLNSLEEDCGLDTQGPRWTRNNWPKVPSVKGRLSKTQNSESELLSSSRRLSNFPHSWMNLFVLQLRCQSWLSVMQNTFSEVPQSLTKFELVHFFVQSPHLACLNHSHNL